jgi:hypothetical protein
MRVWLGLLLTLALGGAAHAGYQFVAAPNGDDNGECTDARPCSPQGAVKTCPDGQVCSIELKPGLYLDPAVNIYYHRTIILFGNCEDPHAVIFRATKSGTLVWIQDHAIGAVRCLTLEATAPSAVGISGRQHIIADYERVIFGAMPEGVHIRMNEFSIASCIGPVWITGDASVHAAASDHSKLNVGCHMTLSEPRAFTSFVSAAMFRSSMQGKRCSGLPRPRAHSPKSPAPRPCRSSLQSKRHSGLSPLARDAIHRIQSCCGQKRGSLVLHRATASADAVP